MMKTHVLKLYYSGENFQNKQGHFQTSSRYVYDHWQNIIGGQSKDAAWSRKQNSFTHLIRRSWNCSPGVNCQLLEIRAEFDTAKFRYLHNLSTFSLRTFSRLYCEHKMTLSSWIYFFSAIIRVIISACQNFLVPPHCDVHFYAWKSSSLYYFCSIFRGGNFLRLKISDFGLFQNSHEMVDVKWPA